MRDELPNQLELFRRGVDQRHRYHAVLVPIIASDGTVIVSGETIQSIRSVALWSVRDHSLYARAELCHWENGIPKVFETIVPSPLF